MVFWEGYVSDDVMGTFVRPYRRLLALRRLLPAPAAVGPLPTAYQERRGAEEPGDAVDCGEGRTVATARPSDRRASTLLGENSYALS
ncbi:hypothetical protein BHE74_00018859 [Ensete ventricosum]|uniref:Uncharacterized protein n=1 Tax=Ensete ventricosum TaxID=4639 RepID=A0A445MLB5_ENSVE|nr:hypothetical protein BHE74_00018859 [Ensete ventricosum]RZR75067.1 hypothetical protein BHM03_00048846 [Ensete ventricosum]